MEIVGLIAGSPESTKLHISYIYISSTAMLNIKCQESMTLNITGIGHVASFEPLIKNRTKRKNEIVKRKNFLVPRIAKMSKII